MSEKEKMLNQQLYDANYAPELIKARTFVKELCYD
ncbi:hypothetical protein E0K97_08440 [Lactobacillus agilis]|nr:maltose acetyltransferase domain-containing protein [Ligilactobacillus agilis]NJE33105.1 hypothetical protein [Ligilactobacillus agilis]